MKSYITHMNTYLGTLPTYFSIPHSVYSAIVKKEKKKKKK